MSAPAPLPALSLRRDAFGRLALSLPGGGTFVGVVPVRCFPLTDPDGWVSFCDEGGREVHCLEDRRGLSPEARALLEEELALREFVPEIRRIVRVTGRSEPTTWEVETDRGPATFVLPAEDHVRPLRPHGALIADSHGVRYVVPDTRRLDAKGRRILDRYL